MCVLTPPPKKEKKPVARFCLTSLAAALVVALPSVASAATINSTDPASYPYVVTSGTENVGGESIQVNGADVNLSNGAVQKHGVLARSKDNSRAVINLGDAHTRSIHVDVDGTNSQYEVVVGIMAANDSKSFPGGKVTVQAENLNIHVQGNDQVNGIYAQNRTVPSDGATEKATVIIDAENTVINAVSATGQANGINAMSEGIIRVNGNLEVNADNAILARGDAIVEINKAGNKTVRLNGDIAFDYDKNTSGTGVNADMQVNLSGADSYWNGNAKVTYDTKPADDKLEVKKMQLGLADGAQWNPTIVAESATPTDGTKAIAINRLSLNDGVINLNHGNAQTVRVDTMAGKGGTVNIKTTTADGVNFNAGSLEVGQIEANNGTPDMKVNFTGITADDVVDMSGLKDQVVVADKSNGGISQTQTVAEGVVKGALTQTVNENGVVTSLSEQQNTGTESLQQIGAMNFLTFRAQMNDVAKRMGDLRTMPQASGMWARAIAGQSEYKSIHNTYQTLQIGADRRIGDFYVGGAVNYTDGDGKLDNGSTDDKNWSFGLYGGWLGEDGQFVDIIVKRHKLETDYDISYLSGATGSGSMDTWGTSASVEYGKRFSLGSAGYYVEPQAELMIGHLNSVSYTNRTSAGDVRVKQDGIKTTVGRLGLAGGWISPDKTGSLYVKASVLHDWEGDAKTIMSKDGISRSDTEEMGGTWGEFALGGTWNINKSLAAYGEVETTAGNPVRTTYQVSAGVRYSF